MNMSSDDRFMKELRAAMEADLTGTAGAPSLIDDLPSGTADPYQESNDPTQPDAPGAKANPTDLGGESKEPEEQPYQGDQNSGNAGAPGDSGDPAQEGLFHPSDKSKVKNTITWADVWFTDGLEIETNDGYDDSIIMKCLQQVRNDTKSIMAAFEAGQPVTIYKYDCTKVDDPNKAAAQIKAAAKYANAKMVQSYEKDNHKLLKSKMTINPNDKYHGDVVIVVNKQQLRPDPEHPGARKPDPATEGMNPFKAIAGFFQKKGGKPMDMGQLIEAVLPYVYSLDNCVHGPAGKRMCQKFNPIMENKLGYANDTEDLYDIVSFQDMHFAQIRGDAVEIDPRLTPIIGIPFSGGKEPEGAVKVSGGFVWGITTEVASSLLEAKRTATATGNDIGTAATESDTSKSDFDNFLNNMNGVSIINHVEDVAQNVDGDKLKDEANDPTQPDAAGEETKPNPPQNGQPPQSIGSEREPGTGDTQSGNAGNPTGVNGSPVSKSGVPTGAAPSSFAAVADAPNGNPPSPGVDATPDPSLESFIGACERTMIDRETGVVEIPAGMTLESYAMEIGMAELTTRALESDMTAAERRALPDSAFGLPEQRKWPLNDEPHVRQAIKYFWRCPKENQKELAKNILKAMRKFGITDVTVSANNPFKDYYPKAKVASGKRGDGAKSAG